MALPLVTTMACTWPDGGQAPGRALITSKGATTGSNPSAATRAAVSLAPGSGRVISTLAPGSSNGSDKEIARTVGTQARCQFPAEPDRI